MDFLFSFRILPFLRLLARLRKNDKTLSLTVNKRKNRCGPCIYWAAAIFAVVTDYSNLSLRYCHYHPTTCQ